MRLVALEPYSFDWGGFDPNWLLGAGSIYRDCDGCQLLQQVHVSIDIYEALFY